MSEQKAEAEKLIAHTNSVAASAALADIALAKSNTEAVAALGVAAAATAVALELSNKNAEEAKNLSNRNVKFRCKLFAPEQCDRTDTRCFASCFPYMPAVPLHSVHAPLRSHPRLHDQAAYQFQNHY